MKESLHKLLDDAQAADLTAMKTASIVSRNGHKITGFVVCHPETHERCIVEMSACRWLTNEEMWWLMHVSESPLNVSKPAFVVVAYRYGLRDDHSYAVGAFNDVGLAIQAAEDHVQHRGGKYACEVLDCDVRNQTNEYDDLPRQVAYIESSYFGLLGRGSQCADDTDKEKRLQSVRWFMDEMRLPLLLRRVLAWPFNAWRWIMPNDQDQTRELKTSI